MEVGYKKKRNEEEEVKGSPLKLQKSELPPIHNGVLKSLVVDFDSLFVKLGNEKDLDKMKAALEEIDFRNTSNLVLFSSDSNWKLFLEITNKVNYFPRLSVSLLDCKYFGKFVERVQQYGHFFSISLREVGTEAIFGLFEDIIPHLKSPLLHLDLKSNLHTTAFHFSCLDELKKLEPDVQYSYYADTQFGQRKLPLPNDEARRKAREFATSSLLDGLGVNVLESLENLNIRIMGWNPTKLPVFPNLKRLRLDISSDSPCWERENVGLFGKLSFPSLEYLEIGDFDAWTRDYFVPKEFFKGFAKLKSLVILRSEFGPIFKKHVPIPQFPIYLDFLPCLEELIFYDNFKIIFVTYDDCGLATPKPLKRLIVCPHSLVDGGELIKPKTVEINCRGYYLEKQIYPYSQKIVFKTTSNSVKPQFSLAKSFPNREDYLGLENLGSLFIQLKKWAQEIPKFSLVLDPIIEKQHDIDQFLYSQ